MAHPRFLPFLYGSANPLGEPERQCRRDCMSPSAIGKVSVNAGTKAMMPLFLAMIVVLFLITYIPSFTIWLPGFVR